MGVSEGGAKRTSRERVKDDEGTHHHKQSRRHSSHHKSHRHKHKHRHHKGERRSHRHRHKHRGAVAVELDEGALQSALISLEVDALEAVRSKAGECPGVLDVVSSGRGTSEDPGALDVVSSGRGGEAGETAEESDTSQDSETEDEEKTAERSPPPNPDPQVSVKSDLEVEPDSTTTDGAPVVEESEPEPRGEESRAAGTGDHLMRGDQAPPKLSATLSKLTKPKTIRINLRMKDLPRQDSASAKSPERQEDKNVESSNTARSVTSRVSKVTYVNLKAKPLGEVDQKTKDRGASPDEEIGSREAEVSAEERSDGRRDGGHRKRRRLSTGRKSRSRSRSIHKSKRHRSRSRSDYESDYDSSANRKKRRHSSKHRKSRSHSRSRSERRSIYRSSSRSRHRSSRNQSRSRSRRKDYWSRSRSRSRQRSSRHGRSRSPYRHHLARSRSRSRPRHSWKRHSRSHSPRIRGGRSRSRSRHSRKRRRHHSRSRSHSTDSSQSGSHSRPNSRPQTPKDGGEHMVKPVVPLPTPIPIAVAATGGSKKVHIAKLTAFCEDLVRRQVDEEDMDPETLDKEAQTEIQEIRAPFEVNSTPSYQSGLVFHNNAWKTPNQIVAETNAQSDSRPVVDTFPVSTGVEHQKQEDEQDAQRASEAINIYSKFQPVSVGELVVKRLEATRTLQQNPSDVVAQTTLCYIEKQTKEWAESQKKPGQFTGAQSLIPLSRDAHRTGIQAWAKKDMFHGLAPVVSGFGLKMLKKMGWKEGRPLGRKGEGHTEPIAMDVKLNRSGLATEVDRQQVAGIVPASALQASSAKSAHLIQGKHPVSALQEICAKKKWDPPHYEVVDSAGPSHSRAFLYRVTVPMGSFQPAVASPTKKAAKSQAATACLQALGFVNDALNYVAS